MTSVRTGKRRISLGQVASLVAILGFIGSFPAYWLGYRAWFDDGAPSQAIPPPATPAPNPTPVPTPAEDNYPKVWTLTPGEPVRLANERLDVGVSFGSFGEIRFAKLVVSSDSGDTQLFPIFSDGQVVPVSAANNSFTVTILSLDMENQTLKLKLTPPVPIRQ